jgi:hypothetical protein
MSNKLKKTLYVPEKKFHAEVARKAKPAKEILCETLCHRAFVVQFRASPTTKMSKIKTCSFASFVALREKTSIKQG